MTTPYTAQWYEEKANKIKATTWKESDRFTNMDRLDLKISSKLASKKAKLLEILNDPKQMYAMTAQDKQTIATLKKYSPSLFKEAEPIKVPQTYLQKKQKTAANKITQLGLTGIIKKPGEALIAAGQKGYLPDLRDKNILGIAKESVTFPLNKLMQTLNIFPRTLSATASQAYKKGIASGQTPKISDFKLANYDVAAQARKNLNPLEALKTLNIGKEGWKEVGKAAVEPIINIKSPYSGTGFTQLYEEMYPDTKLTKPFEFTKDWEKGNWGQRLVSGFAGSPADILGLASDIVFDPLTYITGGLAKGAKTGVSLADDLIKGGSKILPKGAEIGLTKTGRIALETFTTAKYGNVIDDIAKGVIKSASGATDDIAKATMLNAIKNKAINEFVQEVPDIITLNRYLDYGGTKFMGTTVIPGYKYAEAFGKLKNKSVVKTAAKLFDENAGIPNELVPFKNWLLSAGEAEKAAKVKEFATIIKGANEADLDKVQKYMWQMADIERANNKLADIGNEIFNLGDLAVIPKKYISAQTRINNLIAKYTDRIKGFALTDKQLGVADNLADFWKKQVSYFTQSTGKPLKAYDIYSPIRYVKEEAATGLKSTMLGAIDQPFVKARNITMAQAERLKLQPKSLVESTMQRLYEQERNVFRSRLLNEVKQFGSDVAQEGMVKIKDIPELAGTYLPKEYEKVFKTTYSTFFGDDAFKNVMKVYDKGLTMWKRWALATPGYHFRNFFTDNVSGLMEYGMDWYNPKHWSDMAAVLGRKHKLITLNGVKRYADDVFREMVETGELVTQTGIEGLVGSAKGAMKYTPAELSLKFGVKREDVGRVLAGVIERDAGSSKIMSAANVKKVFFDYAHSLTPFERNIAKRAIPFYTWLKNNLRRQVELIFKRTGAYATIPKAMNFVENISNVPEGYDEFKPDYYKDLGAFATPLRNPGLPDWLADLMKKQRTTQAGDMLVANPNLAFQDWSRLNPKDFFSSFAPQLKVPIELLTDKNIYFGSKINEGQKNKEVAAPIAKLLSFLPASVLEKMGVTKTADGKILVPPRVDYLLKQLPPYALTQRGFAGTENSPFQNLSMLGGIKFFPYNEEKAKTSYTTDWQKEANRQLGSYEQKQGEGYNLPATDDIGRAYKQIYADYLKTKYPKFAVANQIKEITKYGGKTAEITLLIKLMEKPYNDELDKIKDMSLAELTKMLSDLGINPTMEDVTTILNKLDARQ